MRDTELTIGTSITHYAYRRVTTAGQLEALTTMLIVTRMLFQATAPTPCDSLKDDGSSSVRSSEVLLLA